MNCLNIEEMAQVILKKIKEYEEIERIKDTKKIEVPINVSGRHVHLSQEHIEALFGKGYTLTPIRDLMQPGEFAAKETVIVVGPKGILQSVRVLGPARKKTQVEVSKTDCYTLGLEAPVRDSGNHEGTPGCIIVGPVGAVKIEDGVIVAMRHVHMPKSLAEKIGIKDKDLLKVEAGEERKVIFENVLARVSEKFVLEMHVDTDEANAAGIKSQAKGYILL
ncbi:MAG: Phosphate propanoyltransferase [Caldanaerobacter subterraneus]|jgi:putative phosphotransacetylase|uniref:Phosphate propanoyltransferase n=1 Tax=Caldanaerobacter subterraneus TaxID=911092 RepID=A0A101E2T1_9THEO|nr:phosphate propanoyltransferase [Caldanaerobacter subterraneus]KUK07784.1 MAG: Phosphate propanoyltransferase [Caldanaerobacter subterraneus]MBZ4656626.1 Propanediol utilization protein [Thermoanaerobacter sp.]HBT49838.1 propanediol utilization protein [Caldanaerobacter subterraneus]